jgi:1-acyl-sn-glycerol-3-phosphate acyltransferase
MSQNMFADKLKIISAPMPYLTSFPRRVLKSFLFCFDHLITAEDFDKLTVTDDPLIFTFNHNCSYETLLVPAYLISLRQGRKISFIIDWMFGYLPVLAWLFKQIDPIYVYNKRSNMVFLNKYRAHHQPATVYEQCIARLKKNQSIGIFPEGTRNRNPESLLKGKKGIGYIALHSQAPVLPIGIDFPSRIQKGRIPKFGRLILKVGRKMYFNEECAIYRQINNSPYIHPAIKRKINDYLCDKITYAIMKELALLSGKQYPFQEPLPPVAMKRFLYDPVVVETIQI